MCDNMEDWTDSLFIPLPKKAHEHQQPVFMCSIDFKKAFDSISHSKLWTAMTPGIVSKTKCESQSGRYRFRKFSYQERSTTGTRNITVLIQHHS